MRKIGRYLIRERLSRGGMGVVYKALAPITNRVVALKILLPRDKLFVDLVGEDKLREIFIEEARIMRKIDHEHVAKIVDCDGSAEVPFIVLEYFARSLGALIKDSTRLKISRAISINMAYHYIHQTLRGLERLHFAGIVHRDIKPHNLMITNDDQIKIIDFGLCKERGEDKMVIPGMQVGSPYYTAPEQERNPQNADERSDLFSVGVIAYRLLTGRLVNHRDQSVSAPSTFNINLTGDWDDFLLKSVEVKGEHRFQSAYEMRLHLDEIYAGWVRQSK
ncbi:MAG: serine/threonine-protein kinase [Desulforhopalus sp.]